MDNLGSAYSRRAPKSMHASTPAPRPLPLPARVQVFLLAAILSLSSGCASLSEHECRAGRWYALGEADGRAGRPEARLAGYRDACAEYGIRPVESDYIDGRIAGLRNYCRIENAFREGLEGRAYHGVCPAGPDELRFRRYHAAALEVQRARDALRGTDSEIERLERTLRAKKDLDERERQRLRENLHDLEYKRLRQRDDLGAHELTLDRMLREAGVLPAAPR